MIYTLPKLDYAYDALEPYIDETTMMIHHTKHHQGYVDKLNKALEKYPDLADHPLTDLLSNLSTLPEDIRTAVLNNGGGHANHSLFWKVIGPTPLDMEGPVGELGKAIEAELGSFEAFKKEFTEAALGQFGSGWAWLSLSLGKLKIESTPNQDSPIIEGNTPILGLDVWEHAYYLKYQNRRADYVEAFWKIINWSEVEKNYQP